MYQLPTFFLPYEDETGYSWISRLTIENGLSHPDKLFDAFVAPDTTAYHSSLKNDVFRHPDHLSRSGGINSREDTFRFIQKHSIFPALAPMMTRPIQDRYINLIFRNQSSATKRDSAKPLIRELHYCKECQAQNLATFGETYTHRIHQLPGVHVCPNHNTMLFDCKSDEPVSSVNSDGALLYAKFAKELLDEWLPCDFYDIRTAIRKQLKILQYESTMPFDTFTHDFRKSPLSSYFPADIANALRHSLLSTNYLAYEQMIALLCFLFHDVPTLREYLPDKDNKSVFFKALSKYGYSMTSTYDPRLVTLHHNSCATEFFTTPHAFLSGWFCPVCDCKLSEVERMKQHVTMIGNGHYRLISIDKKGKNSMLTLYHKDCNCTSTIRTNSFLHFGTRCKCENQYKEQDIRKIIADLGPFKVVKYIKTELPIKIMDTECGHTFSVKFSKFCKSPYCRACHPKERTPKSFGEDVSDLVGAEYSIVRPYTDKDTPVSIRHDTCGKVSKYLPRHFLCGIRCPHCKVMYTQKDFEQTVLQLSGGLYKITDFPKNGNAVIQHTKSASTQTLTKAYILQELKRPTPSLLLPHPAIADTSSLSLPQTRYRIVFEFIQANYQQDEIIILSELKVDSFSYRQIKSSIKILVKKSLIYRIGPGLYAYVGQEFTNEQITCQQQIIHQNRCTQILSHSVDNKETEDPL